MQFSFLGFSTVKIMEFNLDVKDMIILKYFNDFKNSEKMSYEIVNGEKYYWLSYKNIENELPFLGLAKRAIMARMLKMKKLGILKHYTKKDGGTFSYYALGERFDELLYSYSDDNKNNNDRNNYKNNTDLNNNDNEIIDNSKVEEVNRESSEKTYNEESAVDELKELFNFRSKEKSSKENISNSITYGMPFNEEGINIKEDIIDNKELDSNKYDENMQHNLKKGMLFDESECENVQVLAVKNDKGCALKERTKTNILNNNKTIVTNIYNKNNNIYNNIKDIVSNILTYLNEKVGVNYKFTNTKIINLIKLRLKDGFVVEDFKTVVDKKVEGWKGTSFEQYLNPFTLFGDKFELYLNQKVMKKEEINNTYTNDYRQQRKLRFDNFTGRSYDYDKLERQLLGWE